MYKNYFKRVIEERNFVPISDPDLCEDSRAQFDAACPIDPETNLRVNPLTILLTMRTSDSVQNALLSMLKPRPTHSAPSGLTDDEKIAMCVSRYFGQRAELDVVEQAMSEYIKQNNIDISQSEPDDTTPPTSE